MLLRLNIRNIALVSELGVEFEDGLNILTGETGAGKSAIVGSLELALGERGGGHLIRSGEDKASVEAMFDMSSLPTAAKFLSSYGFDDAEGGTLLLRREISSGGRAKCLINGHLATLGMLKVLGSLLIDIHSHNDHQSLLKEETHIELLDEFGRIGGEAARFRDSYETYINEKKEYDTL
ncbi:MAG: AAA family ATPase [Thermoplasmata archaeon]|nr:AAA family ATPase [Thermoplasmata archaeon]